mgnify:CR=1 FL=1
MLPDNTTTTWPGMRVWPEIETECERLARILWRLRSRRKRLMIIIEPDGSLTVARLEKEGSFPPEETL